MRLIKDYSPPSPADLEQLKADLGYTGAKMADLALLAGNNQWRKYTGGTAPRPMSPHMLFFIAAQLTLDDDAISRVYDKMEEIGATLTVDE